MKVYRAWKFNNDIEELEATRVTESSVFIAQGGRERRNARSSEYENYFEERQHAIDYLKDRAWRAMARATGALTKAVNEMEMLDAKYPEGSSK